MDCFVVIWTLATVQFSHQLRGIFSEFGKFWGFQEEAKKGPGPPSFPEDLVGVGRTQGERAGYRLVLCSHYA